MTPSCQTEQHHDPRSSSEMILELFKLWRASPLKGMENIHAGFCLCCRDIFYEVIQEAALLPGKLLFLENLTLNAAQRHDSTSNHAWENKLFPFSQNQNQTLERVWLKPLRTWALVLQANYFLVFLSKATYSRMCGLYVPPSGMMV